MKQNLFVIKVGGQVVDDAAVCAVFLQQFAALQVAKILVHGGGKEATSMASKLGIQQQMVDGRRITDSETLKVVTMVYAGWINKTLVAGLQALHCNAFGLSGADGNAIKASKRAKAVINYGFAGDVQEINTALLQTLLQQNLVPVLCPITHNGEGQLLNTNADTIAATVAAALSDVYNVTLIYSFEKEGVLQNVADENSVIGIINKQNFAQLKSGGIIAGGMLPKLDNAFNSVDKGVAKVVIGKAEKLTALAAGNAGTTVQHD